MHKKLKYIGPYNFKLTCAWMKIEETFITLLAIGLTNGHVLITPVMKIVIVFINGTSKSINLCIQTRICNFQNLVFSHSNYIFNHP
jgi:hypothetical protein